MIGESGLRDSITVITVSLYWGYYGIMETKMETTILGLCRDYIAPKY